MAGAASSHFPHEPANYDEVSMQQSVIFSDSLKDLNNLTKQLYSAAEYFELSYANDSQKQIVVKTLKDYVIKALVNTVDHLGTVSCKVNDLMSEKDDDLSGTLLHLSSVEQRFRTCQNFIDREGLSQQSLVIDTPKYHKRYIIPVGETEDADAFPTKSKFQGRSGNDRDGWPHFQKAIRAAIKETPTVVIKGCSPSLTPELFKQQGGNFSFSYSIFKHSEKRTATPNRSPLLLTGSLPSKPTTLKSSNLVTPNSSRSTTVTSTFTRQPSSNLVTPNYSRSTSVTSTFTRQPNISEFRRSVSMQVRAGKESVKDEEKNVSKGKRFLKALLSRRKAKKDDTIFTYLDEY